MIPTDSAGGTRAREKDGEREGAGALLQLTTLEWKREGGGRRSVGRESEMGELQISFLSIQKEGTMEGNGMGWGSVAAPTNTSTGDGAAVARRRVMTRAARASVGDGAAASFYCRLPPPFLPISGLAQSTAAAKGSKTASEQVERI